MFKKYQKSFVLIWVFILLASLSRPGRAAAPLERVEGKNRYLTSRATAQKAAGDTLVLASGRSFADSLSATNLINGLGARLLLVQGDEDINSFLQDQGIRKVYLLGGENTLSKEFEARISVATQRVSGRNRYETNQASLRLAGLTSVGIASGEGYADALSASKYLKEQELGLLLVNKSNLGQVTKNYKVDVIFGGPASVPWDQAGVERIWGPDRVATSIKIHERCQAPNIILVSGKDFADALSAVNLTEVQDASIVLAAEPGHFQDFAGLLDPASPAQASLVGGAQVLTEAEARYTLYGEEEKPVQVQLEAQEEKEPEAPDQQVQLAAENQPAQEDPAVQALVQAGLSTKEAQLAHRINQHRQAQGLAPLRVSKSLTQVARTHVEDSNRHHPIRQKDPRGVQGNLHSWSQSDRWKGGAYTPDHQHAAIMWDKPRELTTYPGKGYEISTGYLLSEDHPAASLPAMSPDQALASWIQSPGHHAVMIGQGSWAQLTTFGVGIDGAYAHVWFGQEADPAGYYN